MKKRAAIARPSHRVWEGKPVDIEFTYKGHCFVRRADGAALVVPLPGQTATADWPAVQELALSFDGYADVGSFDACAAIARRVEGRFHDTGKITGTETEIRAALYFLQRACRHRDRPPSEDEMAYPRAIVAELTVRNGEAWVEERSGPPVDGT